MKRLLFTCQSTATAKDSIEAIGVPHVEVAAITINGTPASFSHRLHEGDEVNVYPYTLFFPGQFPKAFVLDVHLGKLARLLRMLGLDTHYQNDYDDREIVQIAVQQQRAVLTRDIGLLKHKVLTHGYWLRSQHPELQLQEVIRRFSLCDSLQPFHRCMVCNGLLSPVAKQTVLHLLPSQTQQHFIEFFQCERCGKVFWKGSHFERMEETIQRIRLLACQ